MNQKLAAIIIIVLSIAVPALVVVLMFMPERYDLLGLELGTFPFFHALINGLTAILLLFGLAAIKQGNRTTHRNVMMTAFLLSAVFLVSYVISKISHEPVTYGGTSDLLRYIYYFILITHIVLSAAVLPMILYTMYLSWTGRFEKHKKIARFTFPIWLYVAITGVLVYIFMQPYY